jgi:hypothetical protein
MYTGKLLRPALLILVLALAACAATALADVPAVSEDPAPMTYGQRTARGLHSGLANLVWGPLEIIGQPIALAVSGHPGDVELSNVAVAPAEILRQPFVDGAADEGEGLGIVGFVAGVPVGFHKGAMRMLYGLGTIPSAPFGVYTPWDSYWQHKQRASFVGLANILYGPLEVVIQPMARSAGDENEFLRFVRFIEGIPIGVAVGSVRVTYGALSLVMSPFDSSVTPALDKMLEWANRTGPDHVKIPDILVPETTE